MSEETYIMKRTEIPCPNCGKRKVTQESATIAICDECGQRYSYDHILIYGRSTENKEDDENS